MGTFYITKISVTERQIKIIGLYDIITDERFCACWHMKIPCIKCSSTFHHDGEHKFMQLLAVCENDLNFQLGESFNQKQMLKGGG